MSTPITTIIERDIGDRVFCDLCNEEYTNRSESGGFLFCSSAYCPQCADKHLPAIIQYREEKFIKAHCPEGMPFAQWVLQLRNGNNTIKITTIK